MFVSKKKYDEMNSTFSKTAKLANIYIDKYQSLLKDWNDLVEKVNSKGGEEFLNHGIMPEEKVIDKEMINKMIRLCHPDKHGNSLVANEVTAYLNGLKDG